MHMGAAVHRVHVPLNLAQDSSTFSPHQLRQQNSWYVRRPEMNPHKKIKPTGLQSIRTGTFPSIQAPCHASQVFVQGCSSIISSIISFRTHTETISKAMVQNLTHSTVTALLVGMSDIG